jgi:hypothetical protein
MATDEFDFGGEPKSYPCKGLESKRAFAIRGKYLALKKAYPDPLRRWFNQAQGKHLMPPRAKSMPMLG